MNPTIHKTAESPGPLPIVIGVSGHRDLRQADLPILESRVREILEKLKATYPATPMILLSALAEGADRLVARVALGLGFRLAAPLPMPNEEYAKDFPDTVAEFNDLLEQAEKAFPLSDSPGQSSSRREHCYALVGAYCARHCQILLALWDGIELNKVGGTSHVVRFKLNGVEPPYGPPCIPLNAVVRGPVYHLITPRASSVDTPTDAFALRKLFPVGHANEAEAEKLYRRVFQRMDRFNRDAQKYASTHASLRRKCREDVLPEGNVQNVPPAVRRTLILFGVADSLALHFQRRTLWTLRILMFLVLTAAICFQLYSYVQPKPLALAIGYLAALLAAYLVYLHARWRGDFHNRYLDYRALAEGLRVHLFWRLAGLRISVSEIYLRKQHGELDWIRQALRVWTIPAKLDLDAPEPTATEPDRLQIVLKQWVEGQAGFFERAWRRDHRKARVIGIFGYGFFCVGLALAFFKVVWPSEDPVIIFMSLTLVISVLLSVYSQVLGLTEHANQYARLKQIFDRGAERLRHLLKDGKMTESQELVDEMGQEALIENGDWLLFHRAQPVEVPRA
jgi:hypothetical protein